MWLAVDGQNGGRLNKKILLIFCLSWPTYQSLIWYKTKPWCIIAQYNVSTLLPSISKIHNSLGQSCQWNIIDHEWMTTNIQLYFRPYKTQSKFVPGENAHAELSVPH